MRTEAVGATWARKRDTCLVFAAVLFMLHAVLAPGYSSTGAVEHRPQEAEASSADESAFLSDAQVRESLGSFFIENTGQVREGIRYYSRGNPAVAFDDYGLMVVTADLHDMPGGRSQDREEQLSGVASVRGLAYTIRFENSNRVSPVGRDDLGFVTNFFMGNDPLKWRSNVHVYGEVVYQNIYDGIDVVYRAGDGGLKYEFRVKPFAETSAIRMTVEGVQSLRLDAESLIMQTALGDMVDSAPYSYTASEGLVDCRFVAVSSTSFGFDCADYDRSEPLTIDPLLYSTFLGRSESDSIDSMAVSDLLRPYVTGYTYNIDFPATAGAFDTIMGGIEDAFVAKFNDIGTLPFFISFLGGDFSDAGHGIAIDRNGDAYITGETDSANFPVTATAFQRNSGGFLDAFVVKMDSSGTFLNYSAYLGGSNIDAGSAITVNEFGDAFVTGYTYSSNFPVTPTAFNKTNTKKDAFVTKVFRTGDVLAYSTYLGGGSIDTGYAIAVDAVGAAYVTGETWSDDFHTTFDGYDTVLNGTYDSFVTVVNPGGSALLYSTYLGGNRTDTGQSLVLDDKNRVFVTGMTSSADFPVSNGSFDRTYNGGASDAFVTKLDIGNNTLNYSTFFGGSNADEGAAITIDSKGVAYVAGSTNSTDLPMTPGAFDPTPCGGTWDVFVMKLKEQGQALLHSTYLAGSGNEYAHAVAVDFMHDFYVAGSTGSASFPVTPGAYQTSLGGRWDGFLTKIPSVSPGDPADLIITSAYIWFKPASPVSYGTMVNISAEVHNIGGTNATQVRVRFHDGPPALMNQIGPDIILPHLWLFTGFGLAEIRWLPDRVGLHTICVVVDPYDEVDEIKEYNNDACANLSVFIPPSADLTLTPDNITFTPPSPVLNGTQVTIAATVRNVGAAESVETTVKFMDGVPDAPQIGASQFLGRVPGGASLNVSVIWSTNMVGTHTVCVSVDPDHVAPEYNENNNLACVNFVVSPPGETKPDYVPTAPSPASSARVGVSSPLQLSISVLNSGNASATWTATLAFYEDVPPRNPFARIDILPVDPGVTSGPFSAAWIAPNVTGVHRLVVSIDYYGDVDEWREDNNQFVWTVEVVTGPITTLNVGAPNCTRSTTYVRSFTPLGFSVIDQSGKGINYTYYRIDNVTWENFTSLFFLSGDGVHYVEWYSEDKAGNKEAVAWRVLIVDEEPPATTISVGEPKHVNGGIYVRSSTSITLSALDDRVGANSTFYRVWNGSWREWREYAASFNLAGTEGAQFVEFLSFDYLGNKETVGNETLILDNTPPATSLLPAVGPYTTATFFTLPATDEGCGTNFTRYSVDGGSWNEYATGFTLPEGTHNVSFFSEDWLGNREAVKWLNLTVERTATPQEESANYKPIVALVFAAILAVAGVWSSRRRPWKGGKERMAAAKAFMFTSLPFVVVEATTGVASFSTGMLSIPPLIGMGTLIDSVILVAGLGIAIMRLMKSKPEALR